jgi:hypothetical protein
VTFNNDEMIPKNHPELYHQIARQTLEEEKPK